jgi:protein-disulfide isomerase
MHARAQPAAEAVECAGDQGKFWEYHDVLFANQRALADSDLKKYAADLGLDSEAFDTCLSSGKHRNTVLQETAVGRRLGVTGTPAFFVNGRFLSGAQPFDAFKNIIDEELGG